MPPEEVVGMPPEVAVDMPAEVVVVDMPPEVVVDMRGGGAAHVSARPAISHSCCSFELRRQRCALNSA